MDDDRSEPVAAHREHISNYLDVHPYLSWLGVRLLDVDVGRVEVMLPYDEKFVNTESIGGNGVIHGGIIATLLDHVSGMSVRSTLDHPRSAIQVTTNLDVSYVRPAKSDLYATGEVVRAGTGMGFSRATVEGRAPGGERKVVATSQTALRRFLDEE